MLLEETDTETERGREREEGGRGGSGEGVCARVRVSRVSMLQYMNRTHNTDQEVQKGALWSTSKRHTQL